MSHIYGAPILDVSRSHTTTHHSRQDSSGRVISSSQRPLPDNTRHSQQTNIHAPGGIRTHDLSRRAAVDLRLRPRGYWDRLTKDPTAHKLRKSLLTVFFSSLQQTIQYVHIRGWREGFIMPLSYSKPVIVMGTLREYKDTMMRSLSHYTFIWILYSRITFATKLRA